MKRLPVNEMFYLPTRDYSYEISHAKRERVKQIVFALLLVAFILAFIADNMLGMTVAHAQTKPVIRQNDYYCNLIKQTGEQVIGGDYQKACAEYN